ncbi:MAG: hypothetical protein JNL30_00425 [Rubrivivax sp.]|nr:hypothetical protein [Rubrivivax sp.]
MAWAAGLAAAAPAAPLDELRWLAGCWQQDDGHRGSVEVWLPAAGNSMLGMSRTVRGGRTVFFEFMQLRSPPADNPGAGAAAVEFVASPSGRAATTFRATALSPTAATFENPAHDFPQRIVYEFVAATGEQPAKLRARIEGVQQGRPKTIHFPMTRAPCDAAFAEPKP